VPINIVQQKIIKQMKKVKILSLSTYLLLAAWAIIFPSQFRNAFSKDLLFIASCVIIILFAILVLIKKFKGNKQ